MGVSHTSQAARESSAQPKPIPEQNQAERLESSRVKKITDIFKARTYITKEFIQFYQKQDSENIWEYRFKVDVMHSIVYISVNFFFGKKLTL